LEESDVVEGTRGLVGDGAGGGSVEGEGAINEDVGGEDVDDGRFKGVITLVDF
jgi:hypothetical protein